MEEECSPDSLWCADKWQPIRLYWWPQSLVPGSPAAWGEQQLHDLPVVVTRALLQHLDQKDDDHMTVTWQSHGMATTTQVQSQLYNFMLQLLVVYTLPTDTHAYICESYKVHTYSIYVCHTPYTPQWAVSTPALWVQGRHCGGSDTVLKPTFLSLCCSGHLSCSTAQTWLTCCAVWYSGPCWGTWSTPDMKEGSGGVREGAEGEVRVEGWGEGGSGGGLSSVGWEDA